MCALSLGASHGLVRINDVCLSVCLQNGKVLFPAPQPNNVPVAAPPKTKSVQELEKEKASSVSPFRTTLTTTSAYTGGKAQARLCLFPLLL